MLQDMTKPAIDIASQPQRQPTSTVPARPQRDAKGHWLKGVSGNARGTLEGSRRAFSADFIRTLADDFRLHGRQAIEKVRKTQPAAYLKVCALLVPREHKVEHRNPLKAMSDEELEQALAVLRQFVAECEGGKSRACRRQRGPRRHRETGARHATSRRDAILGAREFGRRLRPNSPSWSIWSRQQ